MCASISPTLNVFVGVCIAQTNPLSDVNICFMPVNSQQLNNDVREGERESGVCKLLSSLLE